MNRKAILVLVFLGVLLQFASCKTKDEGTVTSSANPLATSDTQKSVAEIFCEDGSGCVNFSINQDDVMEALDEYGINYEVDGCFLTFEDGSVYSSDYPGYYYPKETANGFCIGDSVEKMKSLYGEPQLSPRYDIILYSYQFEVDRAISPETGLIWMNLEADGLGDSATIRTISIHPLVVHPEGAGA